MTTLIISAIIAFVEAVPESVLLEEWFVEITNNCEAYQSQIQLLSPENRNGKTNCFRVIVRTVFYNWLIRGISAINGGPLNSHSNGVYNILPVVKGIQRRNQITT